MRARACAPAGISASLTYFFIVPLLLYVELRIHCCIGLLAVSTHRPAVARVAQVAQVARYGVGMEYGVWSMEYGTLGVVQLCSTSNI